MPRKFLTITLLVLLQLLGLQNIGRPTVPASPNVTATTHTQYGRLPLTFEPNVGQAGEGTDFLVHHGQAVTAFSGTSSTTLVGGKQVTMALDGANESSFVGEDELPSKTNYFIGNDQSQWRSNVPNFQKLLAKNVYAGIDLAYYGTNLPTEQAGSTLEHDFIVNPGADYHQIAFSLTGQDNLTQDHDGNLVIRAGDETLQLNAPTTYQLGEHDKHTIPSRFELSGTTVTVAVTGEYDRSRPLVIDPTLTLKYSTYLGGSGIDNGLAIRVDASGNAYVVGFTASTNFPTSSAYQGSSGGGTSDAFVTKFNETGSGVLYSTYLGGSGLDYATSLTLDASGNAYVIGRAGSADFPTASPYQASNAGGSSDAFLAKLNTGGALTYGTYLGGSGEDTPYGIVLDAGGNMYLGGFTDSTDFPTTGGAYQASNAGGQEAFAAKFNAAGSILSYATYLGGTGNDVATGIAVDTTGNVYLPGTTTSGDFPTVSPYQAANANPGSADVFVAKLNTTGSALVYSTYLGGTGTDFPPHHEVVLDSSGALYIAGFTDSTNFPTTGGAYQTSNAGGTDAFLTKLSPSGSALDFSTYLGGSGNDIAEGLDVTAAGDAYVAGQTTSTDFPTVDPLQVSNAGGLDGFVAHLDATGATLAYGTYLGGSGNDSANGIVVDASGAMYLTGSTTSTNFPTTTPLTPYQANSAGGLDVFLAKISTGTVTLTGAVAPELSFSLGTTTCDLGHFSPTETKSCTHTFSVSTNAANGYSVSYIPTTTLTSGANTVAAMASQAASTTDTEQFGLNLAANTASGSNTASNFGAVPTGGTGTAASGYQTGDLFKFATAGDTIAGSAGPSLATVFTASFIANVQLTTAAGTYTAPITYNVVASY